MAKRVLIFSLAYYPMVGGAEVALKELTDRLPDIEFDMVTLRFAKEDAPNDRIGNVNVYRIGGGAGYLSKILFVPEAAAFAWEMHRKKEYDCFWAMMSYMSFPIVLARLLGVRTPYVLTLQDGDPFEHVFTRKRILPFKPLLLWGFRGASVVQAISTFLADWARQAGVGPGKIEVVPNGVDAKSFRNDNPRPLGEVVKLITTSRLVLKNGVGDIIDALKLLPDNVKLEIVGSGPLEDTLKGQVESLGLKSRVTFKSFRSNLEMPELLHNADIFVRPSLSEGQGISFIEAMAAGLPVIATRVGGIPDFLFDPDTSPDTSPTGLFVKVHNPEDIARQVKRLMEDEALRLTLIENGKTLVKEKYEWDSIAERMKDRIFGRF